MNPTPLSRPRCRAGFRVRVLLAVSVALLVTGLWRVDGVAGGLGLAGLALIATARWLGAANLAGLAVSLEAPQRVSAGTPFPLRLTLVNTRRWLDAHALSLQAGFPGGAVAACRVSWVGARSAADFDTHAAAAARGHDDGVAVAVRSVFPLGFFTFEVLARHPHEMLVLARPLPPREIPALGVMLEDTPLAGATPGEAGGDLRGLRPWQPGDSPRRIAWPATTRALAGGGQPLVRETDPPGYLPKRCLLVVHSFASGGTLIRPQRFERTVAAAGGWLDQLHALGVPARMTADFDDWKEHTASTRGQITRCHERLARAVRSASTEAHELVAVLARAADDETVVVLSDMPSSAWSHHLPERTPACLIAEP